MEEFRKKNPIPSNHHKKKTKKKKQKESYGSRMIFWNNKESTGMVGKWLLNRRATHRIIEGWMGSLWNRLFKIKVEIATEY